MEKESQSILFCVVSVCNCIGYESIFLLENLLFVCGMLYLSMERKTNIGTASKEGKEKMDILIQVLNMFSTKEGKFFWLQKMVNQGQLSKAQAGYITVKMGLI